MERPADFHRIEFENKFAESEKESALRNIRSSMKRRLEVLDKMQKPNGLKCVIVGSGPSAKNYVDAIRDLERSGACILAVNESHDWLIRNGIHPWGAIYTEVAPWHEPLFCEYAPGVTYFIASQCDPSVFDWIGNRRIVLWHALQGIGEDKVIAENGGGDLIAGSGIPSMRAVHLMIVYGFRDFEFFGVDSSYETNSHVVRTGERSDWSGEMTMEVWCAGRMFKTKPYLAKQAEDFTDICRAYGNLISVRVHGDGLLPHIYKTMYPELKESA